MLRVTIHSGRLATANHQNLLDWLDIGYERLAPMADYKIQLFKYGVGSEPHKALRNYPRYAASLWDLVARSIALALSDTRTTERDQLRPYDDVQDKCASVTSICAVIDHHGGGKSRTVTRLATAEIIEDKKVRGQYELRFDEDILGGKKVPAFRYTPDFMRFADLLMRASLVHLYGNDMAFPPRPTLHVPRTFEYNDERFINPDALPEPARTSFRRWMMREDLEPFEVTNFREPLVEEAAYVQFLSTAV